jgi:uncharacterized protein YjbI with pentapeptide repeats
MNKTYIEEETIENVDFSEDLTENMEYEYCTFKNCNFSNCQLTNYRFSECEFIDCNFSNAGLADVSLQDVKFVNCKMLGLHFDDCNEFGFSASFDHCQLNHSIFYQMKLGRTSFYHCQLHGTDFTEANLTAVPLKNCDLMHAVFINTNLEKADFSQAINYSIDPSINKIKGAKFSLPEVVGLLDVYNIKIN